MKQIYLVEKNVEEEYRGVDVYNIRHEANTPEKEPRFYGVPLSGVPIPIIKFN